MLKEALHDLTEFSRLGIEERKSLAQAVVAKLGEGWSAEEPSEDLDGLPLRHGPTDLGFVVVPGGSFEMGLRESDIAEFREYMGAEWTSDLAEYVEARVDDKRPVHCVRVLPFLVARSYLSHEEVERLSGGRFHGIYCYRLERHDARQLAASYGLRFASEAEFEWLARDGGRYAFTLDSARKLAEIGGNSELLRSRFGMLDLFEFQWVEDDYHPTYEGAPETSVPWMNGDAVGVARGLSRPELVDEPDQALGLLAALRTNETQREACIRFAYDLPDLG